MILPGMPSGRPCALAKTPARTRKHCDSAYRLPGRARPIMLIFRTALCPRPSPQPLQSCFCLLSIYVHPIGLTSPAFSRILPPVSRSPIPVTPKLTASHNMRTAFSAAASAPSASVAGIISRSKIQNVDASSMTICERFASLGHSARPALPHSRGGAAVARLFPARDPITET